MLGTPELLVILAVIVVIFGPGKISNLGKALGKGIHDFNKVKEEGEKMLKDPLETIQNLSAPTGSPAEPAQKTVKPSASKPETT